MHCPNIGHYNCIGVRGGSSIIKKVTVSSSFGYLVLDSVVAPHDKMDVSKQTLKTMHFTLNMFMDMPSIYTGCAYHFHLCSKPLDNLSF